MELWIIEGLVILAILGWACFFDLRYRIIPNFLIALGALLKLVFIGLEVLHEEASFFLLSMTVVLSAAVMLGLLLGSAWLAEALTGKDSLGGGDVKLMTLIATYYGIELGVLISAGACVLALGTSRFTLGRDGNSSFPFAPYLFVSSLAWLVAVVAFTL